MQKLQMNSLYGKFGQRREKEQIVMFPKDVIGLEPLEFLVKLLSMLRRKFQKQNIFFLAVAAFCDFLFKY